MSDLFVSKDDPNWNLKFWHHLIVFRRKKNNLYELLFILICFFPETSLFCYIASPDFLPKNFPSFLLELRENRRNRPLVRIINDSSIDVKTCRRWILFGWENFVFRFTICFSRSFYCWGTDILTEACHHQRNKTHVCLTHAFGRYLELQSLKTISSAK